MTMTYFSEEDAGRIKIILHLTCSNIDAEFKHPKNVKN